MSDQIYNIEFIPYYHHIKRKYKLTENETILYGFIRFYTSGGNEFYFSSESLSEMFGIANIDNPINRLKSLGLIETETKRMNIEGKFVSRRKCVLLNSVDSSKNSDLLESVDSDLLNSVDIYKYINIIYNNKTKINKKDLKILSEIISDLESSNNTDLGGIAVEQAIEVWNSVNIDKWHRVKINDNSSIYKDIQKKWAIAQKSFTKEEFYNGLEKYIAEIGGRRFSNDKSDYYYHRFTFSEFLSRERGLKKFAFL